MKSNLFRLEVDTGSGGYGLDLPKEVLLGDIAEEYGKELRNDVEKWVKSAKTGEQFHKFGINITRY